MRFLQRAFVALSIVVLCAASARAEKAEIPSALFDYVGRPDSAYAWKIVSTQSHQGGKIYNVELTSQVWQGITWKHVLQIHEPKNLEHREHVLLYVTGGRNGRQPGLSDMVMGGKLAAMSKARVAMLFQVPNQPLFGGRVEDDLISDSWLRYLETGDETWPLLFPMVKSAVKAIDAIQEIAEQEWKQPVKGVVISGASKRGWTSWLSAAADKRIVATAPIVIDVLNFRPQMRHQLETWGKYSVQIRDYTSKGLIVEGEESVREKHLRRMMDPYTYLQRISQPKLLVNGTNDPYWVCDAMKLYWDDLVGPKYVLQVPNAGHGLDGGRMHALETLAVFFQHAATETSLPQLKWERSNGGGKVTLQVFCSAEPVNARLWSAHSNTKDFRESKWSPQAMQKADKAFAGSIALPAEGHVAHYAELQFELDGLPYSLCTLIQRD